MTAKRAAAVLAVVCLLFFIPVGASAWVFAPTSGLVANAVRIAPGGDVVVAAQYDVPRDHLKFAVLRISATTGREVWRFILEPSVHSITATSVALDGAGDVVAAGAAFAVVKLGGEDGSERWRYLASPGEASAVVVDGAGDVIAAGFTANPTPLLRLQMTVVKLSGVDGHELWRRDIEGTSMGGVGAGANALQLDAGDDVLVGGIVTNVGPTGGDFIVLKLAGGDGMTMWRREIDGSLHDFDRVNSLTRDPAGDVVAGGGTNTQFSSRGMVAKLADADGSVVWVSEIAQPSTQVWGVVTDSSGDVIAAGDPFVVKLSGGAGGESWRSTQAGEARAVGIDATSDIVATGGANGLGILVLADADGAVLRSQAVANGFGLSQALDGSAIVAGGFAGPDLTVVRFSDRVTGRHLTLFDGGSPSDREVRLDSKDRSILAAAPGSPPDPTVAGATLELVNPSTSETASFALPAANWTHRSGSTPGSERYDYADATLAAGPCKRVRLQTAKKLSARCEGSQIAFTLDEASQGSLGVRLTIGAGAFRYCLLFGGTVIADTPGVFKAVNAPAPAACP